MADEEWFVGFFAGLALDLWKAAIAPEQTLAECAMLEGFLVEKGEARLLDIPCGPGRHLLEMSRRGYVVTGVDLSEKALQMARTEARKVGEEIRLVRCDVRNMLFEEAFDGAYCLGNSFAYFDARSTRQFLSGVSTALKPEGLFILDTGLAAESILPRLEERQWYEFGDLLCLMETDYEIEESCLRITFTFLKEGRKEVRTARHYIFTVAQIREWLEESGLSIEGFFSDTELEPYEVASPNLIIVARKNTCPPNGSR